MSSRQLLPIVAVAALAGFASSPASAALLDRIGVYGAGWEANVDGTARIDAGSVAGTPYDLVDDGGTDDTTEAFELGMWFHPVGRHRIRAAYLELSTDGTATLGRPITADGFPLLPGAAVASRTDLKLYEAHYGYSFLNMDIVNVAAAVGVDHVDSSSSLRSGVGGGATDLSGTVPVVGVTAHVQPVGFFRAYAEIEYANWDAGGLDSEIVDFRLRLEFYFAHVFGLGVGYRDLKLRVEDSGEGLLDTRFDGFQALVLLRF